MRYQVTTTFVIMLLFICPGGFYQQGIFADHFEVDDVPLLKEMTNPNFVYSAAFFADTPFPNKIYNEQLGLFYQPELVRVLFVILFRLLLEHMGYRIVI